MTDTTLVKRRIADGKTDRLREWMAEVREREQEAIETLEDEGVLTEAAFIEHTPDGQYLVYYLEAADMDHVQRTFEASSRDIDVTHREVMEEVLADEPTEDGDFELLYHLVNPDRG